MYSNKQTAAKIRASLAENASTAPYFQKALSFMQLDKNDDWLVAYYNDVCGCKLHTLKVLLQNNMQLINLMSDVTARCEACVPIINEFYAICTANADHAAKTTVYARTLEELRLTAMRLVVLLHLKLVGAELASFWKDRLDGNTIRLVALVDRILWETHPPKSMRKPTLGADSDAAIAAFAHDLLAKHWIGTSASRANKLFETEVLYRLENLGQFDGVWQDLEPAAASARRKKAAISAVYVLAQPGDAALFGEGGATGYSDRRAFVDALCTGDLEEALARIGGVAVKLATAAAPAAAVASSDGTASPTATAPASVEETTVACQEAFVPTPAPDPPAPVLADQQQQHPQRAPASPPPCACSSGAE